MKITFSQKMNEFPTLIFSELLAYKKKLQQEGKEIIDLSVGSPDLPPPDFVREELAKLVQDETQYGYSLTGIPSFHEAVRGYYKREFQVDVDQDREVLMVMGSQDGLVHLPLAFANPGDYILVPDPGYTAYEAAISLAGAKPYPMALKEENNFLPDLQTIPQDVLEKTKLMILNFPGNPVPALATKEFFANVVQFANEHNIIVLHDFAYSELYYDEKPISFLSIEGASEVGVEFNSLSKSFNMAGCRIGYVVGNETVIDGLNRLKSNLDYGVFIPIQKAAIQALTYSASFTDTLRATYKNRRDVLVEGLKSIGWDVESPKASMFLWAKIPQGYTSMDFAYKLLDEAGIVVTPGNAFGQEGEGYVRIALVQSESLLLRAVDKIKESNLFSTLVK
ncbi:LL-diaminopimelate aminotransferase [Sutcliffiella cohnii]|uniref:LL-diaminopimelate aminotransferase n=1 Tax=Sutcliffiella cohnii TaxID=33932 RepID=UPI002E24E081|nr:LL-diaminopimelate aminotransferase [Sutcliffiella cohnii]